MIIRDAVGFDLPVIVEIHNAAISAWQHLRPGAGVC